jgi:hypothetical protein
MSLGAAASSKRPCDALQRSEEIRATTKLITGYVIQLSRGIRPMMKGYVKDVILTLQYSSTNLPGNGILAQRKEGSVVGVEEEAELEPKGLKGDIQNLSVKRESSLQF